MESSTSEFSTASPDEQCLGVTKKERGETKNSESFRGCEYQAFADGILSPTMPSPISKEGIEQYLDFDIEDNESISDHRAMLQDYVKSAEKAANVSDQQRSHLSKETSEGQRTALSKDISQKQLSQPFQGIIQTIMYLREDHGSFMKKNFPTKVFLNVSDRENFSEQACKVFILIR